MVFRRSIARLNAFAFLLAGLGTVRTSAQLVQPNLRIVDSRNGLSHDQVNTIAMDGRGYLWLGTAEGLNRFNGTRMKVYKSDGTSRSIPNDRVQALVLGADGLLYMGGGSAFLTLIDPLQDTLVNISLPGTSSGDMAEARIDVLFRDREDRIWVGHGKQSLSLFDPKDRTFRTADIQLPSSVPRDANHVKRIIQDADGTFWLGMGTGLVRFDPATFTQREIPMKLVPEGRTMEVDALLDLGDSLLLGTHGQGLLVLDKRTGLVRSSETTGPDKALFVQDLLRKDAEHVWVATLEKGLLLWNVKSGVMEHFDRSLTPMRVLDRSEVLMGAQCFLQVGNGSLWVGTSRSGAAVIAGPKQLFSLFALPRSAHDKGINGVVRMAADVKSGKWFALTDHMALHVMDSSGVNLGAMDPPSDLGIARGRDMHISTTGAVWVLAQNGLWIADVHAMRFRKPAVKIQVLERMGGLSDFWPDRKGGWWCLGESGLFALDTMTGKITEINVQLPGIAKILGQDITAVLVDRAHRIWIGQSDRPPVLVQPDGTFSTLKDPAGSLGLSVAVSGFAEAADGTVWTSTFTNGLIGIRMDSIGQPTYQWITANNGLDANFLYAVEVARNGMVWGTSKSGIFSYDPATDVATNYSGADGLPNADLKLGFSMAPGGDRMFQGLHEGFITFTSNLKRQQEAPRMQVPALELPSGMPGRPDHVVRANAELQAAPITLQYDQDQIALELRSTNLVDPYKDRIAYRLTGSDTGWTYAPAQERVTYAQLAPGEYIFEVKAHTSDGPWGAVAQVPFTILPPWWGTWWGLALLALVAISAAYAFFRLALQRRLRMQQALFDRKHAVQRERLRIAGDMHDDIGSGLSVIKVKSEIAAMREKDPDRSADLKSIAEASNDLIDNMRQMVWSIGGGQEKLNDLLSYMRAHGAEYLETHGIDCRTELTGSPPDQQIGTEARQELLRMMKEALHNVVKHAQASTVQLRMEWMDGLHLRVHDNGIGATNGLPTQVGHGVGSKNMKERAERLGGTFESTFAEGTCVHFYFPATAIREWAERPNTAPLL